MRKVYAEIELTTGEVVHTRVELPSKLQWSKTARANGWDYDDPQQNAFVAWHAAKRNKQLPDDMSYEDFCSGGVVDVEILDKEPTEDPEENPTR